MEIVLIKIPYCLKGICVRTELSVIFLIVTRMEQFRLNWTNPILEQLVKVESVSTKQSYEEYEYQTEVEMIETLENNPISKFRKFREFTDLNLAINLPI